MGVGDVDRVSNRGLELSRRLREIRERRGLSQAALGRLVGTTQTAISEMETRSRRCGAGFNVSTLEVLAWALEVDLVVEFRERVVAPAAVMTREDEIAGRHANLEEVAHAVDSAA